MTNVLIGVFTGNGPKYEARRQMCRETWFPRLRGCAPRFVMSCQEPCIGEDPHHDVLHVVCQSGWDYLPQKTRAFMECALRQLNWTHVVKLDDDSFVHPERFRAFTETLTADYIGFDVGTWQNTFHHTKHQPYASGGAGYALSRRAAAIIAEKLTDKVGHEDVLVGKYLADAGIHLTHDPRFCPWPPIGIPAKGNAFISSHALTADQWNAAWKDCAS